MNHLETLSFSIGIPAFKGKFLRECILSVLNQSYKNFELIVINDASPDPIDTIISEFKDPRITYFKNDINIGAKNLVNNWNNCLDKASGDYFVLMGDDDTMELNYLEEFILLIKKYPDLDVYHCRSIIIDENSKPIMITPSWPEYESVYESIWHKRHGGRIHFISDFVYKTKTLKEKTGFYFLPMAWASDDISFYIAASDKGVAHINRPLLNYRKHSMTLSNSGNLLIKMDAILLHKKWLKNFLEKLPLKPMDQLYCKLIRDGLDKNFQKQKVMVMKVGMQDGLFNNMEKWYMNRTKYKVSLGEIFYAALSYLKTALAGRKFK